MDETHPELRSAVRFLPRMNFGPLVASVARSLTGLMRPRKPPAGVTVERRMVKNVPVWLYRPAKASAPTAVMLWIHGGGFVLGSPLQDEPEYFRFVQTLGITVAAVDYRLAPKHPYPAPMDDCATALNWLHDDAEALGVRRDSIIIAGASAGGGLAAGLTLRARDEGKVRPRFQLLIYPMLDDRTVNRTDHDTSNVEVWHPGSNRFGWSSYLGVAPGSEGVASYAAPARETNLRGLPPTWLGVGSTDLFFDEDVAYATRLREAGVPCELELVRGAFHGFDAMARGTDVVKAFHRSQEAALRFLL